MNVLLKRLLLWIVVTAGLVLNYGNAAQSALANDLIITNERWYAPKTLSLENMVSEIDEETQNGLAHDIALTGNQGNTETEKTDKWFWRLLGEPAITNWLMVIVTLAYLIATIFISNANRKSSDAAQSQLEESRLQQRQNVGIQLYDRRRELMVAIRDCYWAEDSKVVCEDVFFMFDSNCARMYEVCCQLKERYILFSNAISNYITKYKQQLPTDMVELLPHIMQIEKSLSKDPLELKHSDLQGLYQFTDSFFQDISLEVSISPFDLVGDSKKWNLRSLSEQARRLQEEQCTIKNSLINEMKAIIQKSITIDPRGTHV